tara:strand:- start:178 stop:375 length:198 start_codon:yes stop_codon:yes gene_type:complete
MNKEEMIEQIELLCKANKNNPDCSVYWLANMIKEIVDSSDLIEEDAWDTCARWIEEDKKENPHRY